MSGNSSGHLSILRVQMGKLAPSSAALQVIVSLQTGDGRILDPIGLDPARLGLPKTLKLAREYRYSEPPIELPQEVDFLKDALASRPDPAAPLWIEMAQPSGTLPIVPWERLLAPALQVPIYRMPYFAVPSVANPGPVDVALCVSSPIAKDAIDPAVVDTLIGTVLASAAPETAVHVFADAAVHDALLRIGYTSQVVLYDPRASSLPFTAPRQYVGDAAETSSVDDSDATRLHRNPWLCWMLDQLGERGVDVVHFIGHGYLGSDDGMLALAESPTVNHDQQWARFVTAGELSTFLTEIGAWIAGITGVYPNFSSLGTRLLADQVARLRVGTVLLHELDASNSMTTLGAAYSRLLGGTQVAQPAGVPVAVYCHPSQTGDVSTLEGINFHLDQLTLEGAAANRRPGTGTAVPGWQLATQRAMERTVADLVDDRQSGYLDATRRGRSRALEFIANAIKSELGSSQAASPNQIATGSVSRVEIPPLRGEEIK